MIIRNEDILKITINLFHHIYALFDNYIFEIYLKKLDEQIKITYRSITIYSVLTVISTHLFIYFIS